MIAVAVITGLLPAVLTRIVGGRRTNLPDSTIYAAMGRGEVTPRPYSLRLFARLLTDKNADVVTVVSMLVTSVALYYLALHFVGAWQAVGVVALWGALPATRRMIHWPLLLDAPAQAWVMMTVTVYQYEPFIGYAMCVVGLLIHERTPMWSALMIAWIGGDWVLCVASVVLSSLAYSLTYRFTEKHPAEDTIAWLKDPVLEAWRKHKPTLLEWKRWVLPNGAMALWVVAPDWWMVSACALSYGACLAAQDRVRVYQAMPMMLCIGAVAVMPMWALAPAVIATVFIADKEI